ncbi:hypothetical protein HK097_002404, partial [Rhizophlyctis rosea]
FVRGLCARREGPFGEEFFQAEVWDDVSAVVVEVGVGGAKDEAFGKEVEVERGTKGRDHPHGGVGDYFDANYLKSRFVPPAETALETVPETPPDVPETPPHMRESSPDIPNGDGSEDHGDDLWAVVSVDLDPGSEEAGMENIGQAIGSE